MAVKRVKKERLTTSKHIEDHILGETTAKVINTSIDSEGKGDNYDVKQGEVHSDIKLEDDLGSGKKIVIRTFHFEANPEAFKDRTPSKQELFDAHAEQIKIVLWKDGLQVMEEVRPQLKLSKNRKYYRIVVGAEARLGQNFNDTALTLAQAAHGFDNRN